MTVNDAGGMDFARLRQEETDGKGFDDIVVYGTPSPEVLTGILGCLGVRGILNLVRDKTLAGRSP